LPVNTPVDQVRAPVCQHCGVDVRQHHVTTVADFGRHQARQVAGAAGEIEYLLTRPESGHVDCVTFPETVNTERHQVIHQVIVVCYGIENFAYMPRFFLYGHILKTEMCGFVWHMKFFYNLL
jgi:hypothetical protein